VKTRDWKTLDQNCRGGKPRRKGVYGQTRCTNMSFLYVKAFESYRLIDRQTRLKLYTTPLRGWSTKIFILL